MIKICYFHHFLFSFLATTGSWTTDQTNIIFMSTLCTSYLIFFKGRSTETVQCLSLQQAFICLKHAYIRGLTPTETVMLVLIQWNCDFYWDGELGDLLNLEYCHLLTSWSAHQLARLRGNFVLKQSSNITADHKCHWPSCRREANKD